MDIEEIKKENTQLKNKLNELQKVVVSQNRSASLGEMIDSIAHQWRQPLMELASLFMIIEAKAKRNNSVDIDELLSTIEKLNNLTSYMSETIDDFRTFLSNDKKPEIFHIAHSINDVINLISTSINKHNIKVDIVIKNNSLIKGVKNELSQAIINIISNAKDILVQRDIKNPKIKITIKDSDIFSVVSIEDNAGGIQYTPLEKIFEPFFTKDKKNGSGVGLFLTKLIIEEHLKGKVIVENGELGARFSIYLKKSNNI